MKLGLQEGLYDKRIADALVPKEPSCGRLYGLLKDHKPLINGNRIPPIRAVISGSGSNTEQISRFLDFYIKPLVKTLPSFVEDTKDFLVSLEKMKNENIPDDVFPVSIDVVSLYGSIPPEDAMKTVKNNLDCRTEDAKQSMPTSFLMSLLRMVFQFNTFEFDGEH